MGTQNEGTCIRKGPWTAEEDEVLISHVKKCGPRDWSSIRSKGLLPRTGKSCRLRWVNKLRPNLKTGCKFSAEEERMVIQLQAQFGNKWAKIATYLPGRTDNDVKNFWSTRRKRFERILQKSTSLESQKNKGKSPLVHHDLPQVPHDPCSSTIGEGKSCCNYESHNFFSSSEEFRMVPLPVLVKENLLNVEAKQPILEATPINMILPVDSPPRYSLSQLHQPEPDFPFLSECKELDQDPVIPNLLDMFGQEIPECESGQKLCNRLPPLGDSKLGEIEDLSTPSILFDDFPPEMLDYLETLTSSSEL